jgi:CRISPR-associated helicase Cas3
MEYYAHSGNIDLNILPQKYSTHINNVRNISILNLEKILKCSSFYDEVETRKFLIDVIELSSRYHDLGKLDTLIQQVLSLNSTQPGIRLINHVDAGVAFLLKKYKDTNHLAYLLSAFFVLSHHIGLQNWFDCVSEIKSDRLFSNIEYSIKDYFRCKYNLKDEYNLDINITLEEHINLNLDNYITIHNRLMSDYKLQSIGKKMRLTGLQIRILFSCFIDADHQDTANHFSDNKFTVKFSELNPTKRIDRLDSEVEKLSKTKVTSDKKRNLRNKLYQYCSQAPLNHLFYLIDATVGNAKTVAALKLALKICSEKRQDRIYSIAPYTNIINQTVNVYRSTVTLPGEPKYNINEIHSKVEFEDPKLRMYNNIWNAPLNVTTAVQFIESLIKNNTSSIRKLHLFANSVIILDEFHNFIPHDQWNYVLELMRDLTSNFNTVFIFSSGSSVFYWDIYDKQDIEVCQVVPNDFYKEMMENEKERVKIKRHPTLISSLSYFSSMVLTQSKNKQSIMIVVNTIKTAVMLTKHFLDLNTDYEIFHLSSYLTPKDRKRILDVIKKKIGTQKIILIATSIVECGVDMSFEIGYRQNSCLSSIIQFDGRINREQLYPDATTYIFDFDNSLQSAGIVTENPSFRNGKQVVDLLTDDQLSPEYCTDAITMEKTLSSNTTNSSDRYIRLECVKGFKELGEDFHVIAPMTITIIIDPKIISMISKNEYVSYRKIVNNSVQIWFTKLNNPTFSGNISLIKSGEKDYYVWTGPYDPIFGVGASI